MGRLRLLVLAVPAAALLAGCGGSSKPAVSTAAQPSPPPAAAATTPAPTPKQQRTSKQPPPSALQAEATSAAAGDIPDNQVFLVFRNAAGGYSMKYPEGWAQSGAAGSVTFGDKNNVVRVLVEKGGKAIAQVRAELAAAKGVSVRSGPQAITIGGAPAIKLVYVTKSAPNAVTGKRVTLVVDRYYLDHAGKEAIVDLGTPQGVDNVDAYRLMIESFRWR